MLSDSPSKTESESPFVDAADDVSPLSSLSSGDKEFTGRDGAEPL